MEFAYAKRPLALDELRLLQVTSVTQHALHFRVLTARRGVIPYTTVSYTWGDQGATEVIYLDGKRFQVRPNLWSCLYYLGQYVQRGAGGNLWVDAICIDQSNNREKSNQVRFMGQTYREAECVSVWLGLIPFPEHIQHQPSLSSTIKTLESDSFDWYDSIADLGNRVYWSRFWVIQEFLLAREVTLHCSNTMMHWSDFKDMLWLIADVGYSETNYDGTYTKGYSALPLLMGRHIDKLPETPQPLHDLIIAHHRSQCKDRRDRIFALLALMTSEEIGLLGRLFPDYSMTEDHVLVITLAHLLFHCRFLDYAEISPDSEELFLGLGIESKWQRQVLLRRAERFDYLDLIDSSRENLALLLADYDFDERLRGVEDELIQGWSSGQAAYYGRDESSGVVRNSSCIVS